MTLRPYQQQAVDAAMEWMRTSVDPFCIEAATGAGKSHIIAEIARLIHEKTGKRVLALAPSAELVQQNRSKYLAAGYPASMFSASAGGKDLRHPVVFGSPLTVKNRISRFQQDGNAGYALVIVDECHGITPTVRDIISAMKEANQNLRVCGLSATPYRLGSGWIFRMHPDGKVNGDDVARDPYFTKCVYQIGARELIGQGYLTPPVIGAVGAEGYDTSNLIPNAQGKFDSQAVDRAYHGKGRKTAAIVADVVRQAQGRQGVMFFAATVQHAHEVLASLPPELSAIVTGETPKKERGSILARFLARKIKYLVNVAVLTTGFDAPHVDLIAILRKTESVGLLQQIIGRGLRLSEGKTDCLVLDYTTNLADHCPDGDLFAPVIRAGKGAGEGGGMTCVCPTCSYENQFSAKVEYL
jgi:DNA repair protein RadD